MIVLNFGLDTELRETRESLSRGKKDEVVPAVDAGLDT